MSEKYNPIELAKSMAWERAKGELNSMLAAEGSQYGGDTVKFDAMEATFAEFIKQVEGEEYHR